VFTHKERRFVSVVYPKGLLFSVTTLRNEVWKELVLAAIGEQFAPVLVENDDINGITVSVRQAYDIIQVWNRIADESAQSKILARIKKLLPKLEFIAHYYKPCKNHADFGRKE